MKAQDQLNSNTRETVGNLSDNRTGGFPLPVITPYSFICRPKEGQRPNQRPQIHRRSQPTTRINKIIRRMDSGPDRDHRYKSHSKVRPRTGHEDPDGEVRYWLRPRPSRFTPGNDLVTIAQEAGWAPGPLCNCAENLAPTRIRSPDPPAHSE
jgi:hypothetical protein